VTLLVPGLPNCRGDIFARERDQAGHVNAYLAAREQGDRKIAMAGSATQTGGSGVGGDA